MRLVHSLNTQTCSASALETQIYTFTLSALYAKRSGFEIVLHTDALGCKLLKYAPYDEIHCDIEGLPKNSKVFAWPKFKAMANEKPGSIHIDGDVFLKKESLQDLIHLKDCDIIIQNLEQAGIYPYMGHWQNETYAFKNCDKPRWMRPELLKMYNCGVVGFKDTSVMREYHQLYARLIKEYEEKGLEIDCVPDLVAEQQLLYDFAKYKGLKVKELLPFDRISETAKEIGYQHLLGISKYKQVDKTKETLRKLDEPLYLRTETLINEYIRRK